ncbi:MAG: GNAT family N-acetyltransferase [Fimbriiglobus sp.]
MNMQPTTPEETLSLCQLAEATGVFKPHEIVALHEVLDDYHDTNHEYGHRALTAHDAGQIVGFVYFAPTAMTDRTWELWWIAVDPTLHGRGYGQKMLAVVEAEAKAQDARILLIETSSTPAYIPTRRFYEKAGYTIVAEIPDFYSDGDGKVISSKRM